MSVRLYMDVHVQRAITRGLRLRGVDVLTAQEDGADEWNDPDLLDRAAELDRVLFTEDTDFLRIAAYRQANEIYFAGIIYLAQDDYNPGSCIADLEFLAKAGVPEDFVNLVAYL